MFCRLRPLMLGHHVRLRILMLGRHVDRMIVNQALQIQNAGRCGWWKILFSLPSIRIFLTSLLILYSFLCFNILLDSIKLWNRSMVFLMQMEWFLTRNSNQIFQWSPITNLCVDQLRVRTLLCRCIAAILCVIVLYFVFFTSNGTGKWDIYRVRKIPFWNYLLYFLFWLWHLSNIICTAWFHWDLI